MKPKVYFIDNFSWFAEKQGRLGYQINSYVSSVGVDGIFWQIKFCDLEIFKSSIEYKATCKKDTKIRG